MIRSIEASIVKEGNLVRHCARPETVVRFLATARPLSSYEVWYWDRRRQAPRRVTAEGFLALYQAGLLPSATRMTARDPKAM